MTFAIPAAPGTMIFNRDDSTDCHVVVGWLIHPGGVASPVTTNRVEDLSTYDVYHPTLPAGVDTMMESFGDTPSAPPAPKSTPARASAPAAQKAAPAASGGGADLTGKEYAKKTFWRIVIGETDVVVTVEGGNPVPKGDGVTKITRDDYFKLRKEVREVTYEDLADVFAGESPEPETGETDDDDDDLI